jgi:predicted transcriptional regulator of viral defense system
MPKKSILLYAKQLNRAVFTTRELSMLSGSSLSNTTQALNLLEKGRLVFKITRGLWAETGNKQLSPYTVIPFLLPRHRAYVSFISALHLHGIIEQIPQIITLASTVHTKKIYTKVGTFIVHQISPLLFDGFDWYRGSGNFLIAEPEKALVDSLYLSSRKKKQFRYFPEMHFSESFSFNKADAWIEKISDPRIRSNVKKKLMEIKASAASSET